MPEISFYVLPSESREDRYLFVCKLIEKAYRSGSFPYVYTDSVEKNQLIDDLLWTFRPGSFVPHQIYNGEFPPIKNSVLISSNQPPENWFNILINLSTECPQDFQKTNKIIEILDNSEETKTWGRKRYRQYQQEGIKIITHFM